MSTRVDPSTSGAEGMGHRPVPGPAVGALSPFKNAALISQVAPPAILVELVERFHVCWETVPEFSLLGRERRRIGFALELYGNHDSSAEHASETCIHCHNVFGSLHVIADWALPRERRAMMHEAEVHFPCQTHSFARQKPAGVRFGIRVVHRGASDKIDEETVAQWSRELEWRLRELGAVERLPR